MINPGRGRTGARRRVLVWARYLLGLGLAALAVWVLLSRRGELSGTAASFRHIDFAWLVLAVVGEAVSMVCFAETMTRLLTETDHPLGLRPLLWITVASNSVANSLPAGPAFGAVYSYRQLTLRGVPGVLAAWATLASGILATAGLAILATVGVVGALGQSSAYGLVGVTLGALAIAAILVLVLRRPQVLGGPVRFVVAAGRVVLRRPGWHSDRAAEAFRRRVGAVTPGWPGLLMSLVWALANWIFDLGCLLCAFAALGTDVPWRGVVLAYGAGQLAANLPITPGGLGVVEGSLTIALVAYGGAEASTVAVVLVYRLLSFWAPLLAGWAAAGALALERRRIERAEQALSGTLEEVSG